jgi:golgi apparatus protein 1
VKEAPPAELLNGDGDVSTTGACEADIDALCVGLPPGEGRLASCLTKRMKDEANGNVVGRKVTRKCKEEVADYFFDRSKNINKNLQLASACTADISKLCTDLPKNPEEGAVFACLRKRRKKLSPSCSISLVKAMIAAAQDFRADPAVAKACSVYADKLCSDVPKGRGRVQACLV